MIDLPANSASDVCREIVLKIYWKLYYNIFCLERDENEYALLAQLVEHLTLNQGVQGSSP